MQDKSSCRRTCISAAEALVDGHQAYTEALLDRDDSDERSGCSTGTCRETCSPVAAQAAIGRPYGTATKRSITQRLCHLM